jgi:hypothetical protein
VDKYKHMPEIKRITRHRHLPAPIYKVRGWLGWAGLGWAGGVQRVAAAQPALRPCCSWRQEPDLARAGAAAPAPAASSDPSRRSALTAAPPPPPPPRLPPSAQAAKLRRTIIDNDKRKLDRRIAHSAPGSIKVKPERKKKIVTEME